MPDDLYDRDILIWSERQADLLRRLAAGERVNADIDWANLIDEVQDLGRSELHRCESLLRQALLHLLKLHHAPGSADALHWRSEIRGFLADARKSYTPSMRQRLDLDDIYATALDQIQDVMMPTHPTPRRCPYTLDGLLAGRPDLDALLQRLSRPD